MRYYIITGASQGLGKALAEATLQQPDTVVLGVSRRATIEHARYRHQALDFSDLDAVRHNITKLFPAWPDADSLTLINNAGVLGDIGYAGEQANEHYQFVFDVNLTVPAMLMNTFLSAYSGRPVPRTVLNISSGAGRRPTDGWGAYCASKAALDMLSQVVQQEQDRRGTGVRIRSLAPGMVDTAMQESIRATDEQQFSQAQKFAGFHEAGQLVAPAQVAGKIMTWLGKLGEVGEAVVLRIDGI